MIKESIRKIVENGKREDMEELSEMLIDSLYEMKEYDYDEFCEYKTKLYELAFGKILTEEMAEDIISNMKPYHMKWSLDETKQVQQQYGMTNIRDIDFWIVMNMAYNDYHDVFGDDVEMYAKYSRAFIMDDDAKEGKVYTYFTEIPKNN